MSESVKSSGFDGADSEAEICVFLDEFWNPFVAVAKEDGCFGTRDKKSVDDQYLLSGKLTNNAAESGERKVDLIMTMLKIWADSNRKRRGERNNPILDLPIRCLFKRDRKITCEKGAVFYGVQKDFPLEIPEGRNH